MIHVFAEKVSERLIYTLDFVCKERNIDYQLYTDITIFTQLTGSKLNYSTQPIEHVVQLVPSVMLFDQGFAVYGISKGIFEEEECIEINHIIDPLASIFYVLSRMEEYISKREDKHGRYKSDDSVLSRFNWLEKVMCDRWAESFLYFLDKNKLINYKKQTYKVAIFPTFDIDNTYAYKYKSRIRKSFSTLRDVVRGDLFRLQERTKVLLGFKRDPYDTYSYINEIVSRGFEVKLFWLLGDYAKYDKNISFKNKQHQLLIRRMNQSVTIGLHPSYKSNSYELYLFHEKERLEGILKREVEHSRQHFLKLKVSKTYPILASMGFKHDYTMGYSERIGFRAGTARPFKWFDLTTNKITSLTIHPFAYMDGTLNEYLGLPIHEAQKKIKQLYNELTIYGGDFIFIWHNETINNRGKWKGWKEVLEYTLNLTELKNE
jgi:hypothetical protein